MMHKIIVSLVFFFIIISGVYTDEEIELLQAKLMSLFNRVEISEIKKLEDELLKRMESEGSCYLLAEINYYYLECIYIKVIDKKMQKEIMNKTLEYAKKAIDFGSTRASVYAIYSNTLGQKVTDPISAIIHGNTITKNQKRAEELDPKNEILLSGIAKTALFAPKIFGGNVDKAIEMFVDLVKQYPDNSIYWTYLGVSYNKKKIKDKAKNSFQKAIELAENNTLSIEELDKL